MELQAKRIVELEAVVQAQAERIFVLEQEIAKLGGPKPKPAWVKADAAKREKGPRKRRRSRLRGTICPLRRCSITLWRTARIAAGSSRAIQ